MKYRKVLDFVQPHAADDVYTDPRGVERTELADDFGGDGTAVQYGESTYAYFVHGRIVGYWLGGDSQGNQGQIIGEVGEDMRNWNRVTNLGMGSHQPRAILLPPNQSVKKGGWVIGQWTRADGSIGSTTGGDNDEVFIDDAGIIVDPPAQAAGGDPALDLAVIARAKKIGMVWPAAK